MSKKMLLTVMAALLTLSAFAFGGDYPALQSAARNMLEGYNPVVEQSSSDQTSEAVSNGDRVTNSMSIASMRKIAELDGSPVKTLATGDVYTIEGKYTITINDTFAIGSTGLTYEVGAEISYDSSKRCYVIKEDVQKWFLSPVPFDFSNNTMTIKYEELGTSLNPSYYAQFAPVDYPGGDTITLYTKMDVPFDSSTGVFTFPAHTGFGWGGWTNSAYAGAMAGWFTLFGITTGVHEPMAPTPEPWTDAGTAVFVDGWVLPVFGIDVTDVEYWYEVPLQQDTSNPNRYRLVDPYHCNPNFDPGDNTCSTEGYINFEVSDPNHVVVEANVAAGWANSTAGVSRNIYCQNNLGFYMAYFGVDANTVITGIDGVIPYTTYKNGVVALDYVVDKGEKIYDVIFGYDNSPLGLNYFGDGSPARIIMPDGAAVGIANTTVKASSVGDKTATISFDFKSFNLKGQQKVYAILTDGRGYTTDPILISGTHADVVLEGLNPETAYTMTLTLEVRDLMSAVFTSFPATVGFTTTEEVIVKPEIDVENYALMLSVGQKADAGVYLRKYEAAAWSSADAATAATDGSMVEGVAYGNTTVTAANADGDIVAEVDVNVCPTLTIVYPEGVEVTQNVLYNTPADVQLTPLPGWSVNSLVLDGTDVTDNLLSGRFISAEGLTADAVLAVVTEADGNPKAYKVVMDGGAINIANGSVTSVTVRYIDSDSIVYTGSLDSLTLNPGAYTVELTDASGAVSKFRVAVK